MSKVSSRSREVSTLIASRTPFQTYGALRGGANEGNTGQLNPDERNRFYEDANHIDYVVYSYATPIAWHSTSRGWHKVAQKFSVTTSKHQGKLYMV